MSSKLQDVGVFAYKGSQQLIFYFLFEIWVESVPVDNVGVGKMGLQGPSQKGSSCFSCELVIVFGDKEVSAGFEEGDGIFFPEVDEG